MSNQYKHVLFDLDRTLWDFNSNSVTSLGIIFQEYDLHEYFGSKLFFISRFEYHNKRLWLSYYQQRISREELIYQRFHICLKEAGNNNIEKAKAIAECYLETSASQTKLIPYSIEVLEYLQERGYQLHIITNGFNRVQHKKLVNSNLINYFGEIISSEDAGASKPTAQIFEYACETIGAKKQECIIIGDDINTDIKGAIDFGMDHIFFNQHYIKAKIQAMYEIGHLSEIKNIL